MARIFNLRGILSAFLAMAMMGSSLQSAFAQAAHPGTSQTTLSTQAVAAVRGMLRANASVNASQFASMKAALHYETPPALSTQAIIDAYNMKHQVQARLQSISIDPHPIWMSAQAGILHARMVFTETLGQPKTHVGPIVWNYDFVVAHTHGSWKVADVLTYAPSHAVNHSARFDLAANIITRSMSQNFLRGLEAYQGKVKYTGNRVEIDAFGYHVDKAHHELRMYLFIHNGTSKPIFNVTGKLTATDEGTSLFSAPLALSVRTFGILLPGKTRLAIVHVALSSLNNLKLTETYPKQAKFSSRFQYEGV